ncbi:MAG TPA: hypothetical protein VKG43_04010 [Acidimicrobiales bacterium]|nr:hypothetical protein [Acidimicrobiales bacterium]
MRDRRPDEARPDPVEETDEESFPASDPPSSWSGEDDEGPDGSAE